MTTGQRVQLHPATSWWARGARYGVIIRITTQHVWVLLDAMRVPVRPVAILEVLE